MGLSKKKEAMVLKQSWPWEVSKEDLPLYIALLFFNMLGFFIGLHIRLWKTMWDIIVPTKLTTFGWRLCRAILHEIFANSVHWLELAVQEISNEDLEWLLTILWASWYIRFGNFIPNQKDQNEKQNPVLDYERGQDHEPLSKSRIRWVPPPTGLYKVNFSGAFVVNRKKGGIGIIIRDDEGFVWGGAAIKIDNVTEASVCEARAGVKALEVAREMGCRRIILESDCFGILSKLSNKDIDEGKRVMGEFEECYVHPIEREGNKVANLIARYSVTSDEDLYWHHDYPHFIHQPIMYDAINL